jgi:hypothetical protein
LPIEAQLSGSLFGADPAKNDSHMNGHKIQQKNRATNFTRLFSSGAIRHAPIPLNTLTEPVSQVVQPGKQSRYRLSRHFRFNNFAPG